MPGDQIQTLPPEVYRALAEAGRSLAFQDGEVLRDKGDFSPDLLFLTEGKVACILDDVGDAPLILGPGTVLGERGFLTGESANATLRAVGMARVVALDAEALAALRRAHPDIAAEVLRMLAATLSDRESQTDAAPVDDRGLQVVRCSTLDQTRMSQRLRYDVLCLERGQSPEGTDPAEGIVVDPADAQGDCFVAYMNGRAVAAGRLNLEASEPDGAVLGPLLAREADASAEVFAGLVAAMATFAEASGASVLLAPDTAGLRPLFSRMGFTDQADGVPGIALTPTALAAIADAGKTRSEQSA